MSALMRKLDNKKNIRLRLDLAAALCGLADSSIWVAFLLSVPVDAYYTVILAVKCILIFVRGSVVFLHATFLLFVVAALLAAGISVLAGLTEPSNLIEIVPFAVSLSLTLALICKTNRDTYFRVFAFSIFLSVLTFLALWKAGRTI